MDARARLDDLVQTAEKLSIEIRRENLSDEEIPTRSGYCKVNGLGLILMDKKLPPEEQIEVILRALERFDLETIYVPAWIRETLEHRKPIGNQT